MDYVQSSSWSYLEKSGPRRLAAPGLSTDKMLFFPVSFASGGSYKVCFCDGSLLDRACATEEDFGYEVGVARVTGLACLLDIPEYRRTACTTQHGGGLRCHADAAPPAPAPPPALAFPTSSGAMAVYPGV